MGSIIDAGYNAWEREIEERKEIESKANASNINKTIDELEKYADAIEPIDETLVKAAKAYVKKAFNEQYEIMCSGDVMAEEKWNGYDLLDAFKTGAEWYRSQMKSNKSN